MSQIESMKDLVISSEEMDYSKNGFHYKHQVEKNQLQDLATWFLEKGFLLEMLTCQDRLADNKTMRVCYTFNFFADPAKSQMERHLVHLEVNPDTEEAPTLSQIYASANWFEREVFDMYGVIFAKHPNLERILLPEDADFHALRKDFGRIEDAEEESPDA